MGASYLERNVEALADGGRLVVIGLQGGRTAELDLGASAGQAGQRHRRALRTRPADEKAAIVAAVREHVWPLVEAEGQVRPIVHSRVPMPEAAEAHRLVEASRAPRQGRPAHASVTASGLADCGPGPAAASSSSGLAIRHRCSDRQPQPMQPVSRSRSRSSSAI